MSKLIKTGQWVWRTGEYGLREYYELSTEAKELHIKFLQTLKPEEMGTNDKAILTIAKIKTTPNFINFLNIDEGTISGTTG